MITRPITHADVPARPGTLGLPPDPRVPTITVCGRCELPVETRPVRITECHRAGGYERNERYEAEWCAGCIEESDLEIEER